MRLAHVRYYRCNASEKNNYTAGVLATSPAKNRRGGYRIPVSGILLLAGMSIATSAAASGWPPWARDDFATVNQGGTVTVLDSGARSVVANDWDFEGDELEAELTREPKYGTLTLFDDGTFVYRQNGDDRKDDEFRYRAFDGTGYSREAKVHIRIIKTPNNPPVVSGNPGPQDAQEGEFFRLDLSPYFSDPDPDDELEFSASGLPGGGRLRIDQDSGVLSGTPNASDVRDAPYSVRITARDEENASASLEFSLTIFAEAGADLDLSAVITKNPVTVGETARWDISIFNQGPADLEQGDLRASWITNGPALSLNAPQGCTVSNNNSASPSIRCNIDGLQAAETAAFNVTGTQNSDGDNSLIAIADADDPNPNNNAALTGGVVASAFSEGPFQIINGDGDGIAAGDFNGDGLPDIVVTASQTTVYFNSGSRTLTTPGSGLGSGSGGRAVAALDWDGDGDLDIAVAGMSSRAARVYLNNGNGQFGNNIDIDIASVGTAFAIAAADFDGDGDDEFVLAGSGNALLVRSSGSGFATSSLAAVSGIDAAVADINGDGLDDIIVIQANNRAIRIMRNSGDGRSFANQTLDRGSVAAVTAVDADGDGDIDLLLAVDGSDLAAPESKVVYQQSGGSFSSGSVLSASPLSKLLAGDIDQDGLPDAIALNAAGVHQVYRGLPSGGFGLQAEQIISSDMQRGLLIDFNNDDSLDLIIAGARAGAIELHANNGRGRLGLGDRVAPSISLVGSSSLVLAAGEPYEELGATAVDDIDGDVTASIVISGSVNTSVVGTYRLTYTARDRALNSATVQRTVQVGVNQGTGGGGGGAAGAVLLCALLSVLALRRRRA